MDESKPIKVGLDKFYKAVLDLKELEVKINENDKVVILLNSLPKSLKNFEETLKCSRESIMVYFIMKSLNSKLLYMQKSQKDLGHLKALVVKGRNHKKDIESKENRNKE